MMILHMTLRAARGICLVGFVASPAAKMTDSVPVYEKAAEMKALYRMSAIVALSKYNDTCLKNDRNRASEPPPTPGNSTMAPGLFQYLNPSLS